MTTTFSQGPAAKGSALVIGVVADKKGQPIAPFGASLGLMEKRGFLAKPGQILAIPGVQTKLYVGLGENGTVTVDRLRSAAALAVRNAWNETALHLDLLGLVKDKALGAQALVEGASSVLYHYSGKAPAVPTKLKSITVDTGSLKAADDAFVLGLRVAEATALVRDLVNMPPAVLTPTTFADRAVVEAEAHNFSVEVWDETRIEAERLGGLHGVSRGGLEPARLVRFEWAPAGLSKKAVAALPTLAVVGKGITFDSGGLSLKSGEGMMTMKCDMAGAATTLGLFTVLGTLAPKVRVIGFCCLSENLPGERATKPGDVHVARNGKSFEILNTDAEGRLVLADGLSLAVEEKPDAVINLATLTGAIIVALGKEITGLFSNNPEFAEQVKAASQRAGEQMWELPVYAPYRRHIDSDVADMKNIGAPGQAGSIAAALFLQEFVGSTPWVHLDIAGTAWSDAPHEFGPRGGTGASLRTLVELTRSFRKN